MTSRPMPQGLTLSGPNVGQRLTLNNVPQQPMMQPVTPPPAMPPMPQADPGFNINTATNTFYKALNDRVQSGQMTLDQARAAQAEMRALQLNPAMANRQAATEIAQRNLQVGPYAPKAAPAAPVGGLTMARPGAPAPQGPPLGGSLPNFIANMNAPKTPPMALPGGTGYDERGNMLPGLREPSLRDILTGMPSMSAPKLTQPGMGLSGQNVGQRLTLKPTLPMTQQGMVLPMTQQGMPMNMPPQPQGMTLSGPNVGQQLTLNNVPSAPMDPNAIARMGGMLSGVGSQLNAMPPAQANPMQRPLTPQEVIGITSMPAPQPAPVNLPTPVAGDARRY